jgi:hypothetical protein
MLACVPGVSSRQALVESHPGPAGAIEGTVLRAVQGGMVPAGNAVVRVAERTTGLSRAVLTNDAGRYAMENLSAGYYYLAASKGGLVTAAYRAAFPDDPGVAIALTPGERYSGADIVLKAGAVISGVVRDHIGQVRPNARLDVLPLTPSMAGAEPPLTAAPSTSATTDDLGRYRLFGLLAGSYLVRVSLPFGAQARTLTDVGGQTEAEQSDREWTMGWPAVFYPGTTDLAAAVPIQLAEGEERTGVDIALVVARAYRIEGVVTGPNALPVRARLEVFGVGGTESPAVRPWAQAGSDGRFVIEGITPGRHDVVAWGSVAPSYPGERDDFTRARISWVRSAVTVAGDIENLAIQIPSPTQLTGQIGSGTSLNVRRDIGRSRLELVSADPLPFQIIRGLSVPLDRTGVAEFGSIGPGRYLLRADGASDVFSVESAIVDGRDMAEEFVDIASSPLPREVAITIEPPTRLSGRVVDGARGSSDHYVVVFPDQPGVQAPHRRVRLIRPATDGTFETIGLPRGDYYVCAVPDSVSPMLRDSAFLDSLRSDAKRVTVRRSLAVTLNIHHGGGGANPNKVGGSQE